MLDLLHQLGCLCGPSEVRGHVDAVHLLYLLHRKVKRGVFHPPGSPEVHNDLLVPVVFRTRLLSEHHPLRCWTVMVWRQLVDRWVEQARCRCRPPGWSSEASSVQTCSLGARFCPADQKFICWNQLDADVIRPAMWGPLPPWRPPECCSRKTYERHGVVVGKKSKHGCSGLK